MPFLQQHGPSVDWQNRTVRIAQDNRNYVLRAAPDSAATASIAADTEERTTLQAQLSCMRQLLRATRLGEEIISVLIKPSDSYEEAVDMPGLDDAGADSTKPKEPLHPRAERVTSDFQAVFEEPPKGLPRHRHVDHKIELLPGAKPPNRGYRKYSNLELDEMRSTLQDLAERGLIGPSISPYGANVLFVRKKNGTLRMCMDYRGLNAITRKNATALPRVDELLDRLHGAKIFSKIDLRSAYHLVRIAPGDEHKTAFKTPYGHFEFKVLSFGLCNAPATFQTLMNDLLRPFLHSFAIVMLDDVLVYSRTEEEHEQHLRQVLQVLKDNEMYANMSKCEFFTRDVIFLGHRITPDGIHTDPQKVQAVEKWPTPQSERDVRRFLGFVNYYRRFIPDSAEMGLPLTKLLKKDVPFTWGDDQDGAFQQLRQALITAPVLAQPDPQAGFIVTTDASKHAIGAVLSQETPTGIRPVAYESKKLSPAESNWPTHEKEQFAIIHALKQWRTYLEGRPTVVYTDHAALQHLETQRDLSERQRRWAELMSRFHLDIRYKPGATNQAADALSRRSDHLAAISAVEPPTALLDQFKGGYEADPYFVKLLSEDFASRGFQQRDGYWYKKVDGGLRLCVPNHGQLRLLLLEEHHDIYIAGHLGREKTLESLKRFFGGGA